jgi:N-acetylmuramoyl-L-alanine amidase
MHTCVSYAMRPCVSITLAATAMLGAPAAASAAVPHVVGAGESLSSVAATDGLSVESLAVANGLPPDAWLTAGSTLQIPPQTTSIAGPFAGSGEVASSPEASPGAAPLASGDGDADLDDTGSMQARGEAPVSQAPVSVGSHVVQPGETLSGIAAQAGVSVAALAAANGIDPNAPLLAGAVLQLQVPAATAAPATSFVSHEAQAAGSQPVGVVAEGSEGAPPYPTPQVVSPPEVGSIAAENGVPPSLAEAVAYQESGFNNALTSPADARGVMQILPGTWSYITESLPGGAQLEPASAASNVRGGALLLHSLLEETGGNAGLAAAGYYQGLPSVLQQGELPETQEYVDNVLALQQQFGGG